MTIEIYSDIACPWCYVGERRLARALAALPPGAAPEVVFRPFQLDPAAPVEAAPLRERLAAKFGSRLDDALRQTTAAGAQEGLDFRFDRALAVNTLDAHRLLRLAETEGGPAAQRAVADALFAAYFTDGRDVADADVLAEIGAGAGLDPARVRAYLASDEGRHETLDAIAHAQRIGVTAVPTFVFDGRYAVRGAQPASVFVQVIEQLRDEADAQAGEAGSESESANACADGACAV